MQEFKIMHFKNEYPDKVFPEYYSLKKADLSDLQKNLFEKFLLNQNNDLLKLVEKINTIALIVDGVSSSDDSFSLLDLLRDHNIQPNSCVYLNWYRYDDVDRFKVNDLEKHFNDIWYPSADDIDIFDETFSWILSIRHDGVTSFAKP